MEEKHLLTEYKHNGIRVAIINTEEEIKKNGGVKYVAFVDFTEDAAVVTSFYSGRFDAPRDAINAILNHLEHPDTRQDLEDAHKKHNDGLELLDSETRSLMAQGR